MKPIYCLLFFLLLPGCASEPPKLYHGSYQEIQKAREEEEDHNFFYGGWLPEGLFSRKPAE